MSLPWPNFTTEEWQEKLAALKTLETVSRNETLVHHAADEYEAKLEVAVRYAFARGRLAVNAKQLQDAQTYVMAETAMADAPYAVRDALQELLPPVLLQIVIAGGDAGLELLDTQAELMAAGSAKSGNYGHSGREGKVGGSGETIAYHGTISGSMQSIRARGIQAKHSGRYYGELSHTGNVYVTTNKDLAVKYAVEAAVRYNMEGRYGTRDVTPVVLEVHIPKSAKKLMSLDEKEDVDAQGTGIKFHGDIQPEWIKGIARVRVPGPYNMRRGPAGEPLPDDEAHLGKFKTFEETMTFYLPWVLELDNEDEPRTLARPIQQRFDPKNKAAITWVKEHATELANDLSKTSRKNIKASLVKAFEGGSKRDLYKEILNAVGDKDRAKMIARSESMQAASQGQRIAWKQAVDDGQLSGGSRRQWIATHDELVCPMCAALDGTTATLNGRYPGDGYGPPLHPACRCSEGIVSSTRSR